jgi:hypothetical protein
MKRKNNRRKHQKQHDRTKRFGKLSKSARLALIEQVFMRYPRLKYLFTKIDFCREFSKISAEPECMLITGTKGAGKTTLIEWYVSNFPIRETLEKRIVPVLVVTVPSPATVKGLGSAMLEALGDPAADKGTVSSITLRLRKYIKDCEVELIILDEFQHFDDRQSKNVLKTISDWLKNLINETSRPITLVGMLVVRVSWKTPETSNSSAGFRRAKRFCRSLGARRSTSWSSDSYSKESTMRCPF